jgi:fumarate reductase subunit D
MHCGVLRAAHIYLHATHRLLMNVEDVQFDIETCLFGCYGMSQHAKIRQAVS